MVAIDKIMEVVSPLTFGRTNQGGKRRFGSPIHGGSVAMSCGGNAAPPEDSDMMDDSYGFHSAKRRKRFNGEGGDDSLSFQSKENWSLSPFVPALSRSPAAGEIRLLGFFSIAMM